MTSDRVQVPAGCVRVDDGTVWIVFDGGGVNVLRSVGHPGVEINPPAEWVGLCRPCDTCEGSVSEVDLEYDEAGQVTGSDYWRCPDCVDGRHVFEIETPCVGFDCVGGWVDSRHLCAYCIDGSRRLRVSVDDILPIVDGYDCPNTAHICANQGWSPTGWLHHSDLSEADKHDTTEWHASMPDDAAVGLFVARCTLHDLEGETS